MTNENKREYVDLVAEHRMTTAIRAQIQAFLKGFWEMVPRVRPPCLPHWSLIMTGPIKARFPSLLILQGCASNELLRSNWFLMGFVNTASCICCSFLSFISGLHAEQCCTSSDVACIAAPPGLI